MKAEQDKKEKELIEEQNKKTFRRQILQRLDDKDRPLYDSENERDNLSNYQS